MDYLELSFQIIAPIELNKELLINYLGEIAYEGFEEKEQEILAYIPKSKYKAELLEQNYIRKIYSTYSKKTIKEQNWNKVWEENYFQPIEINNECIIRADFHKIEKKYKFDILIHPQMSFGTGHHSTTLLIAQELFHINLQNTSVLDMGCGTAILAILAEKLGANSVHAIDNDQWAYNNSIENCTLNNTSKIKIDHGDASLLKKDKKYNIILSNINLNINLENIPYYAQVAQKDSLMLLSGFYMQDIPQVESLCKPLGFKLMETKEHKNWAMLLFKFSN